MHTGFWWGKLREGDHLGDRDLDARIILKCICKKWEWAGGMDWIDLSLVNAVMNSVNFLTSRGTVSF